MSPINTSALEFSEGRFIARCINGRWSFYYRYGYRGVRLIAPCLKWRKAVVRLFWPVMTAVAAAEAA
jgi:hypothetical protein